MSLHIQTDDNELTSMIFDRLKDQQEDIERSIDAGPGAEWQWLRHDAYTFCTINVSTDGTIDDPPERLEQIRAWMIDLLPKFKEVFDPRLADILKAIGPAS